MTSSFACNGNAQMAREVGLPTGGCHCDRRGVATQLDIAKTVDAAQLALHRKNAATRDLAREMAVARSSEAGQLVSDHAQDSMMCHRSYSGGTRNVPLVDIRSDERLTADEQEALEKAKYFVDALSRAAAAVANVDDLPRHALEGLIIAPSVAPIRRPRLKETFTAKVDSTREEDI